MNENLEINQIALPPDYVTGLSEMAGNFTYSRLQSNIVPRFSIKVPDSDRNLIYSVMKYFDVGNVYQSGKKNLVFIASSSSDLEKIIDHFDRYHLQGHKADCYKMWRRIVELKKLFRRSDYSKLSELSTALSEITARGQHRKMMTPKQEQP
ncbi:MAG: LAGLIDADG family homing endonuclease [Elusimicrobiota bacterium]